MKKRGVVRNEIVLWIVAILTLVILGIFVWIMYEKTPGIIDKETCRQSVIQRSNWLLGLLPQKPSLKCKTNPVPVQTTNEEAIKRIIADEMFDCWDMLGEGKIDFLSDLSSEFSLEKWGFKKAKSSCLICSVIYFDERLKNNPKNLDLLYFLETTKMPRRNITYLEYFTDERGIFLPTGLEVPPVKTDQDYAVIFFNYESIALGEPLVKDLGVLAGGFVVIPGARGGAAKLFGAIITANPYVKAGVAAAILAFLGYQTYTADLDQRIAAGYCDGERKGCSQIMLVSYNKEGLSICDELHSIP